MRAPAICIWAVLTTLPLSQALASITSYVERDEIAKTKTYNVIVHASDYASYTNENRLELTCGPTGKLSIGWHTGGAYSGSMLVFADVYYRFDDGEAQQVDWYNFIGSEDEMHKFFLSMLKSKRLIMRNGGGDGLPSTSSSFSLVGLAGKAGPKSALGIQCKTASSD